MKYVQKPRHFFRVDAFNAIFLPLHRMASLIKKDPATDFVLLDITLETDEEETESDKDDASLPPIKYFWGGRK